MRVLAIQNCEIEGFGLYTGLLAGAGHALTLVQAWRGAPLPPHDAVDAVLVGGTPISANAVDDHDFLRRERDWLAQALARGLPCLGICFGAQVLAGLLGGAVTRCAEMEIGVAELALTDAGRADPLLAGFPDRFPVFQWHADAFAPPPGARLLIEGAACRHQLFRRGTVVGLLFHLEVTAAEAARWAAAYAGEAAAAGRSAEDIEMECRRHEAAMAGLAARLMAGFLALARPAAGAGAAPAVRPGEEPVTIRPFRPADAAACLRLRAEAFTRVFADQMPAAAVAGGIQAWTPASFARAAEERPTFLAESAGETVGFATLRFLDAETAELLYLYVDLARARRGVGTRLLRHVEDWLRRHRPAVRRLELDTAVPATNQAFYEKQGYHAVGAGRVEYPDGSEAPTTRMARALRPDD
ncbi:MAG: GNAT family N-acetyltransferase [Candidatus Krumholzibacteriota bacterium]|nr:GNAT family N-acetyltransferase [Candidatus Krumholzibacteriota bacterium]